MRPSFGGRRRSGIDAMRYTHSAAIGRWLLVLFPVAFISAAFVLPIGMFLYTAVDNSLLSGSFARTRAALLTWSAESGPPPAAAAEALLADLADMDPRTRTLVVRRFAQIDPSLRAPLQAAARITSLSVPPMQALTEASPLWAEQPIWKVLRAQTGPWTGHFLMRAVGIETVRLTGEAPSGTFPTILLRTFTIAGAVTVLCMVLAYPVAYLFYFLKPTTVNRLMLFVLIPLWTSLLVRTAAWVILLQDQGVINSLLVGLGIIDEPLQLIFNRFGVYVALTHVLLPFMVLPVFASMQSIPKRQVQASLSLGAGVWCTFFRVVLPQTRAGALAGGAMVFVLALGYYITPLLVGSPRDQMLGYYVSFYVNEAYNWSQASALAFVLLLATVVVLAIAGLLGGRRMLR
jgi:putative spermidine/putrescine transport system permease protein